MTQLLHRSHNNNKENRHLTLHTESQFYLPGDEIIGTVTYTHQKPVSLRSVSIIFAGEEYCVWIDKVAARVGGPVANARAVLFRKETTPVSERTRLEPGPRTWQFRFVIPRSIPPTCSYYGKANVSYWLKAKAMTTFGHWDCRVRHPVTIGQFWVPTIPAPVQNARDIAGGNIIMNVKSSHSVVKCGDVVTLNIQFNNSSSRDLTGVRIKLKQVWECTGVFYHKNIALKFFTKEGFPVSRGTHTTTIQIKIPHRLQSCPTVTNASRFKCTYYLGVFAITKMVAGLMKAESVKCRIPITITNLPPTDSTDTSATPASAENSDESDSDSEEEEDGPAYPRNPNQRASESNLFANHNPRNVPATRSLTALSSTANVSSFDFLNNYRAGLDSQGNLRSSEGAPTVARDDSYGLADLFDEEKAEREEKIKQKKEAKAAGKDDHDHANDEISRECIICYDGPKNMLMLPCAHIATCVSCTSYIMHSSKQCPVCRTKINQTVRVYQV